VMSVGFLLSSPDDAVIWRGPKKNGVLVLLIAGTVSVFVRVCVCVCVCVCANVYVCVCVCVCITTSLIQVL